jgi:polyphosphate kinase
MNRNLDRRVEIMAPVKDQRLRRYLREVLLDAYLRDNVKARILDADGSYTRPEPPQAGEQFSSQGETLWLLDGPLAETAPV